VTLHRIDRFNQGHWHAITCRTSLAGIIEVISKEFSGVPPVNWTAFTWLQNGGARSQVAQVTRSGDSALRSDRLESLITIVSRVVRMSLSGHGRTLTNFSVAHFIQFPRYAALSTAWVGAVIR
jgi:hypothetical protein